MQGSTSGINYHASTAMLRRAERHLQPGGDDAAEEPNPQAPLVWNATDAAVPKLACTQPP
eukprot:8017996-Pyramimonas_sp.AAC.1